MSDTAKRLRDQCDYYGHAQRSDALKAAEELDALAAENARLQQSINNCSTEEGLCYFTELDGYKARIRALEAAIASTLATGLLQYIREVIAHGRDGDI